MARLEVTEQSWSWYGRVPSHSYPGDGPSRLRLQACPEILYSSPVEMNAIPREVYGGFG